MSKNRKNNHYRYAEKYDRVVRGRKKARTAYLPFKALIASLFVLLMFGFVTTTFGAYISENEPDYDPEKPGIITEVRNTKASRDVVVTGARADLAETGATWSFGGGYIYFEKPSTWTGTNASSIQFVIGKGTTSGGSSWSTCYTMSAITNTNYYVSALPSSGWGDATYMAVIGNSSAWGSNDWGSDNIANASYKTSVYTSGITSTSDQRYLFDGSLTYLGTGNSSLDTVTLAAHACYSTTGASNSYTADNATGGTVKISSYYFSAYNTVATSNTGNGAASASYNAAKTKSSTYSTFTATAASGYVFKGWYDAANGGSLVSSSATYNYSTNGGNKTVYARFLKTYTVSISAYSSQGTYDGTAPTVTGGGNTDNAITVEAGTSVTMNSNISNASLFSCTFRSGSSSGTVISGAQTITSNLTIYACFTLAAPTISTFNYAGSPTTEGAAAINPTKTVKSADNTSTGTFNYSYSFVSSGSTGTDAGKTLNTSSGAFSATYAGTYKIKLSATNTYLGLTSSAATSTTTITVKPVVPAAAELEWSHDYEDSGNGTVIVPFKIPSNKTRFYISAYVPPAQRNANYTYNFTCADGTYTITDPPTDPPARTAGSSTYSVTGDDGTGVQHFASATASDLIHNYDTGNVNTGYYYKVSLTKTRNSQTSDPLELYVYYGVTSDYLVTNYFDYRTFNSRDPIQKIYADDNAIANIDADYDAGGSAFHTMLWFSKNNIIYNNVAVWAASSFTLNSGPFASLTAYSALPNDAAHQVDTLITPTISTIARNNVNLMSTTGPKWLKGFVDDYNNGNVSPIYPVIHTTVGTSSKVANRPVYFVDTTNPTHVNSRVMAFYLTEEGGSKVHYQTGETVSGRSKTYRFYVPADATKISFAYVADNSYVLPTFSSNQFSYTVYTDHTVLMAWTRTIDLSAEANQNMTTYIADTIDSTDQYGIYTYTNTANSGNMTTLP